MAEPKAEPAQKPGSRPRGRPRKVRIAEEAGDVEEAAAAAAPLIPLLAPPAAPLTPPAIDNGGIFGEGYESDTLERVGPPDDRPPPPLRVVPAGEGTTPRPPGATRSGRGPANHEAGTMADLAPVEDETWSDWDVGRALALLRSTTPGVVRRTLRKLHIRIWHAPASRLQTLLRTAGAPASVIDMVPEIVDTCRVCRSWNSVSPRAISSGSLLTEFNAEMQFDFISGRLTPFVMLSTLPSASPWLTSQSTAQRPV